METWSRGSHGARGLTRSFLAVIVAAALGGAIWTPSVWATPAAWGCPEPWSLRASSAAALGATRPVPRGAGLFCHDSRDHPPTREEASP